MRRLQRFADIFLQVYPLLIWTVISLVISVVCSEMFVRVTAAPPESTEPQGFAQAIPALLVLALCFLLPIAVAGYGILRAFRHGSRIQLLARIISAYIAIILCAAGVYYSMALIGDQYDASRMRSHYYVYGSWNNIPHYHEDHRAFRGIDYRLWSGIEESARTANNLLEYQNVSEARLAEQASRPERDVILFRPDARAWVFLDCLHLSICTMTTVGYGDISPAAWPGKLMTDIQALSGQVLFVVALGMLFGNWWHQEPEGTDEKAAEKQPDISNIGT